MPALPAAGSARLPKRDERSIRADALLAHGWDGTIERLEARLAAFGGQFVKHSISRIDYAMDFLMPAAFALELDQFVAGRDPLGTSRTRHRIDHWLRD